MFRDALTELASLSVTGVTTNYDVDALPVKLNRGQLPVLLVLPIENESTAQRRLFSERGDGFEAIGFASGVRTVTYTVTHLLLVAPVTSERGLRDHLPGLVDLIDNYFTTLATTITLGGRLLEPTQVKVEPGVFAYDETRYYGCAFRHEWVVQL
jgi:hypothetical protein